LLGAAIFIAADLGGNFDGEGSLGAWRQVTVS